MRLRISVFISSALLVLTAGAAFAQLSQESRDFATGPASYFFTDEEKATWKNVKTDADAKQFMDLFWARRDPTPSTAANEFRDEYNARVEYADRQFAEGKRRGSLTDRGRVLILFGAPTRVQRANASPTNTVQTPGSTSGRDQTQDYSGKQVWIYEQPKTRIQLGMPVAEIAFVDQYQTNQWTLERGGRADIASISRNAIASYVTQPNLTTVPTYAAGTPAAPSSAAPMNMPATTNAPAAQLPTSAAATAGSVGAFKTESLKAAVTDFQNAKTSPLSKNIAVTYTELLSPTGDYYIPVQLYIPKSAGLTAEAVTTFFGVVQDASGNNIAVFEEPATLSTSKGDLYFDRTINVPAGKYKATLGLAGTDGKPVVMSSTSMDLTPLSKDTTSVSRLVLANDVHETEQPATVAAPYAFGRVKIVPKGDHTFTNRDEITYFVEVVNPGLDEGTNAPHLQVKLDLVQNVKNGRTISAPISDATPLPLSGVVGPGQYAILAGIPLGQMKNPPPAGDYTLRVKVYDQVKKANWTVEQQLKLVDGPAPSPTSTSGSK